MLIHLGYEIEFYLPAAAEAFFALSIHPSRSHRIRKSERLRIGPDVPFSAFLDSFGNLCGRANLPAGSVRFTNDAIIEDDGQRDPVNLAAQHLKFDYLQARANRTALEGYREKVGVCRDFMHLAITFCRCMNIPARYATGYLGDLRSPGAISNGFQRLVRGVFGGSLVDLRRPPQ